ncbi:bifunctional 4-hydroxy-2-oxoglutarate aldolase/2-dehydro-3-deoxy-phosphogluconate aldolase [Halobacillus mangrovi]|uniref:2-dehydro-3-deoxyphosphogluconate aldolase n=1 Tax=Halobacillus mangrovi TaxID=402384 RepID=A0A1W5ZXD3_9BACI|nr:bifunctional 4-hydroxy-2-oxoglutarate aldolase/2-dehydro-3-deoxy-phosphogluconate aldolase [Halobacillus mangrovi]ARI77968.1 2-dehydro-3-deoxyphosphogluconate aldolase [Halobacillus mangrovi]
MSTLEKIKQAKIIPVIRKTNEDNILPICEALVRGGIQAVEITAETPNASNLIKLVNQKLGDRLILGAGTVLDPETARQMISAGAEFIVSPTLKVETIQLSARYGIPCIPGAFTPTEMVTAYEAGASMVKVFPANTLGPDYIKNIHGPLPHISLMATGGITFNNMMDYFNHGAEVVGIGSQLVNVKELKTDTDFHHLEQRAKDFTKKISLIPASIG